jgi:hypothetical protein
MRLQITGKLTKVSMEHDYWVFLLVLLQLSIVNAIYSHEGQGSLIS